MLKPKTLKQKVFLYLILIGVLPLIVVFLCSWRLLTFSLKEIELKRLTGLADSARVALEKCIEARMKDIQLLARNPILTDSRAMVDEKLEELKKAEAVYGLFDDITLIDPDGDVLNSVYYRYRGEWAAKGCFKKALLGEPTISKVHIIPDPTKVIMIFATPVIDRNEQTIAVVAGQMNMEEIWALTDDIKIGTSGYLTVTDTHGNYIACPDRNNLFRHAGFTYPESKAIFPNIGRSLIGYSTMGLLKENKLSEWKIAAILPEQEAFAPMRMILMLLGIFSLISLVFIFIGSKVFSRDVIAPIEKLVDGTKRIMEGDFTHKIRLNAKNEIGDLANYFNMLTEWFNKILCRAEETGAHSENIFQAQVDMVLTLSPAGKLTAVNKSALQALGYRESDILGKIFSMFLIDEEKEKFHNLLRRCRRGDIVRDVEIAMVLADDRKILINFNASPIRNDRREVTGVVVVSRDITEKKKLEETVRYMASLVESAAHCIISTDRDGIITSINTAGETMFGYKAEELIGRPVSLLQSDQVPKDLLERLKENSERGESWEAESLGRRKSGEIFPIWLATSYLRDEQGKIKGAVGISRDITERKQALDKLKESEKKYKTIFESANDIIILIDRKGKIVDVNKQIEMLGGYKKEELIGKNIRQLLGLITKRSLPIIVKNFIKRMAGINVSPYEVEVVKKNKEVVAVEINAVTLKEDGKIVGELAILRDITARRLAEEKLRNVAALVETASLCITSTDKNNRILTINAAGEKMLGYNARKIVGKDISVLYSEETQERTIKFIDEKAEKGENWEAEVFRKKKNGEVFPAWVSTSYLFDEKEEKKGALSIMRDLTDFKRLERDLIHADRLATIGTMAAGIAHEIRNPLAGIEIGLEALSDSVQNNKEDAEVIETLHDEIMGLNEVITRLLEYGRRRSNNIQSIDVAEVLRKTFFFLHKQIKDNRVTIEWKVKEDLRKIKVNSAFLQQAFMNIMLNAIQAMENGGILKISAEDKLLKGERFIEVTFEDTGEGIDQETIPQIFNAFTTTKTGGTGLGLPISKKIIEEFGGSIKVESQKGRKTVVRVILPADNEKM